LLPGHRLLARDRNGGRGNLGFHTLKGDNDCPLIDKGWLLMSVRLSGISYPPPQQPTIGADFDEGIKTYEFFRDYVKHEDNLINQRLTWLLTIHGFLYATCGFTLQKKYEIAEKIASDYVAHPALLCPIVDYAHKCAQLQVKYFSMDNLGFTSIEVDLFLFFLAAVGFIISILALISINAAKNAANSIRGLFEYQYENVKPNTSSASHAPLVKLVSHGLYIIRNPKGDGFLVPGVTGGGLKQGHFLGFIAPMVIPSILAIGWLFAIGSGLYFFITHYFYLNHVVLGRRG
jgi:hypothetical protein